jgi:Glycosyl hydrolases family 16
MSTVLKSDPANGVSVVGKSVYYSLGSTHWQNLTGTYAAATYSYSAPGPKSGWPDGEMATMNMANWGGEGKWYSAEMRLNVALGFGQYEQSIKVGAGSGLTTTFYLCEKDKDQNQEIDFEFSGHCNNNQTPPCGTQGVWTNWWWKGNQHPNMTPLWVGTPPKPLPDTTSRWGKSVYRYMIDWEPDTVTWSVDLTGTGNSYVAIRTQDMKATPYNESLCYVIISFWHGGWTPDNSPFLAGKDAPAKCGESGPCYQAFYFQSLKFTPSAKNNHLVTLA